MCLNLNFSVKPKCCTGTEEMERIFLWRKAGAVHVSEYLLSEKLVFKVDLENISLIKL